METYELHVRLEKQEDGLWRAFVPGLDGCFVDAETLTQALSDIQAAAAMFIDLYREQGRSLPVSVAVPNSETLTATLPIRVDEHVSKPPLPSDVRSSAG